MTTPRFLLHVGLPRTGTTSLQRHVFPAMTKIRYAGKTWNNSYLKIDKSPILHLRHNLQSHNDIQVLMATVISDLQFANAANRSVVAKHIAKAWCSCVDEILGFWKHDRVIFSDEALIGYIGGVSGEAANGFAVPLEQIAETGLLERTIVSVVLRDPASSLKAYFYKRNEFARKGKLSPMSFDAYVRRELEIYLRKPSASRIFLCMQKPFVAHMKRFCPYLVVNHYENLIEESHVVDALFGFKTGEKPVRMKDLPRENSTNRDEETIRFILSAPDVPKGISMEEYTASFSETLDHYGLNAIFAETSLRANRDS
jgi:hypothetical protein